ncbi:bestrophin family protein [Floridanema evergladense]|uniref:Bestrophin family protein n=1 Tax=Floridaenema evergladense BLCC-F167 TaxID=3153639 RepID=A0ABV4WS31_9CYAN
MSKDKLQWYKSAVQLRGSVLPAVLPRAIFCGVVGVIVSAMHYYGLAVSLPFLGSFIPNIVLGLLLVFRTNTAYERFWEGRKIWGVITNTTRNLARQIWVAVEEKEPQDRNGKIAALRLLVAFAIATKLHLRSEPINQQLDGLVNPEQCRKLKGMNNPPLEVAFWISDYLQYQYERNCLNTYQLIALQTLINELVDCLGGCERILKTPIPLAYAIHLKQLLLIYCLSLPWQMVANFGWFTGLVVIIISFTLLGIEEIGLEIENPFGYDANDLPLDTICANMRRNIEDLISLAPSVRNLPNTKSFSSQTMTGRSLGDAANLQ